MPRAPTEKMLGANLPLEFVDDFWDRAAPAGTNKQLVIRAMTRLWLATPVEERRLCLYRSESDNPFVMVVQKIDADVLNGLTSLVHHFVSNQPDGNKKLVLEVTSDLFLSLPHRTQTILALTRFGAARFEIAIATVTTAMRTDDTLDIRTAYSRLTDFPALVPALSDIDKALVDEFLDFMEDIFTARDVHHPAVDDQNTVARESKVKKGKSGRARTAGTQYRLLSPEEQKWLDDLRAEAIAAQRSKLAADKVSDAAVRDTKGGKRTTRRRGSSKPA